jgi:glycosyltransferase involved in cell wall biosynthesis
MRVLLTTDTVGGVWTFTKELTQQLVSQGHRVALVSFGRAASATQGAWVDEMAAAHSESFFFQGCAAPLEWMQENGVAWEEGAELLTKVAEKFRADLLHSNQFCWGALPLDVPKVITAHSDVRSWAAACRGKELGSSPWLERYDALVQRGIFGTDALVASTGWMRDALHRHWEVVAPFHVIANGRTLADHAPGPERELRAVSAGRLWDEGKGLDVLNEVVSPMPIVLAGESTFEGRQFRPSVTALGTLSESSLLEVFSASSIYLATSRYEPFGLAPLEAALCGCAIVARELPSFREVWGEAALYFRDASGLQEILTELAANPKKLREKRAAAMKRAGCFGAERMAEDYAALYRELIAHAGVEEGLHAA